MRYTIIKSAKSSLVKIPGHYVARLIIQEHFTNISRMEYLIFEIKSIKYYISKIKYYNKNNG